MPVASSPLVIAALDAGSNAIRAVVARAGSSTEIRELASARWTVRLGHGVFNKRRLDQRTAARAVDAFAQFRSLLDRYEVAQYCAVATSAVREAANRDAFVTRVRRQAGIELTVIDAAEEARLAREAVFAAAGGRFSPRVIADLGGGSLEVSFLRGRKVTRAMAMPLGAVRLMEMFNLAGSFTPDAFARLRRRVLAMLHSHGRVVSRAGRGSVVACGGNAEALARLAPGPRVAGFNTIHLCRLDGMLWDILRRDVEERMEAFGVRRDRAEVIGVAAVVFTTLGEWLGAKQLLVPAVGVREGILHDLAAAHFGPATANDERAEALRQQARRFAARMHSDATHCEQVRRLAAQLFDQLARCTVCRRGSACPSNLRRSCTTRAGSCTRARITSTANIWCVTRTFPASASTSRPWSPAWCAITAKPRPSRITGCIARWLPPNGCACGNWLRCCTSPWRWIRGNTQAVRRVEVKIQKIQSGCARRPGETCLDFGELRRKARYFEKECSVHVRIGRMRRSQNASGEQARRNDESVPTRSAA